MRQNENEMIGNMSDTPETDALEQKQSSEGCPQWNDMMRWVKEHAALARKLERERDEARADAHNYKEGYHIYSLQADSAGRERDEAQRELEMWKFERDEALEHAARYRLEANKLIRIGVELREQNAKLRDIAERAVNLGLGRKTK